VLADFYLCYQQTYLKRSGHTGYLNKEFFEYLQTNMQDEIMIVMAYHDEKCIASALFFYNEEQLFGRYWGALQEVSGLHFECCYYQGIEFAIEKRIRQFNPGTQGEHKILRGFEPTLCYSNHYLQHPDFQAAVKDFLQHEKIGIAQYKEQAQSVLPFKQG
jgi:predicted N-acyltransferase